MWEYPLAGGVALMTMGFIFNPSAVPPSRVEAILGAFARVEDMRFVVKFEEGEEGIRGVEVPKNVMVLPFVPQKEVLAHKNTRRVEKVMKHSQTLLLLLFLFCYCFYFCCCCCCCPCCCGCCYYFCCCCYISLLLLLHLLLPLLLMLLLLLLLLFCFLLPLLFHTLLLLM